MNQKSILKLALLSLALFASSVALRAEPSFDEAPTPLHTQAPVYPDALRREGVSGMVSINVTIDENGNVTSTTVNKSSRSEFDAPALAAVSHWKFKPAKKGGQPVAVSVVVPVRFNVAQ